MSVPCKFERSLLSNDDYETIRITHHPAIYDVEPAELEAIRSRLRKMRAKEQTLSRQKRREARGKRGARGASFPGTAERPSQRKQVFAAALKRINKELERLHKQHMSKRPDKLSPCVERISFLIRLPELQRAKAWRRIRVGVERRSLRAQKSGAHHRRRKSLRRCAIREVSEAGQACEFWRNWSD